MVGIFAVEGHYKSTSGKGAELNRLIFMPNAHHLSGVLLLISAQTSQALTRKQTQQPEENVQRRGRGAGGCLLCPPSCGASVRLGWSHRGCRRAAPAAEQRGADSCLTDIFGSGSTPGIIMGLIGRSVCMCVRVRGGMEMIHMHPDIIVCSQPRHS